MKKSMYLVALAAISLASCSNDEVVSMNQETIRFTAVTGNASRAEITTTANLEEFKTYAYVAEDGNVMNYINGLTAAKNGNVFDFSGISETFYWPENPVDFYFLSPVKDDLALSDNKTIVNYTCDDNNQDDLIYAASLAENKPATGDGILPINFRHALSQVVFKIKSAAAYKLNVQVEGVQIVNLRQQGTLSMPTADTTDPNYSEVANGGTGDKGKDTELTGGSWGVWAFDKNITAQTEVNTYNVACALEANVVDASGNVATADVTSDASGAFLIMPQTVTAATVTQTEWAGAYFVLDVVIKKNGVTLRNGKVAVPVAEEGKDFTWKQGKKYVYTFTFGQGGGYDYPDPEDPDDDDYDNPTLVPISFTVTVDEFQTQEIGVDMPKYEPETAEGSN